MKYYPTIGRNENLIYAVKLMDLESIVLSED
jgi:hypothetical protein